MEEPPKIGKGYGTFQVGHKGNVTYVDKLPTCNFCEAEAEYDGRTMVGPWAYMCQSHFGQHGVGLGVGRGQQLKVRKSSFVSCVEKSISGKPSIEEIKKAARTCAVPIYRMTEENLRDAVMEGVWYPTCPHCQSSTPAEPDADSVYCSDCGEQFRIMNPYF